MQGTFTDDKTRSAETQISAINDTLAKKIGPQKFRIWFSNSTRFTLTGGYLKVGVPNLFIASWIEKHFTNEISQAVREVTGETRKVTFAIDPELSGSQRRTQLDSQAQHVPKLESLHSPKDSCTASLTGLLRTPIGGKSKTDKAAPTDKKLRFTLDTFVVGHSNELAFSAAKAVVSEQKSPFNPLFFHGGYGVGKTHLLHGICNAISKNRPQTRWLYLSAEDFANQFILALKLKKLEHFRQKMRQTDLLAIDDIHFLASKPSTQEEFLHTFNTINLAGKQVILASDAHPKMIGQLSEKLVNRFISGMVVKINSPDFQTRCEICQQYAAAMIVANFGAAASSCQKTGAGAQKQIPENVIRYVAENLRSNVRELEGAMLKLVAYSALQNEKINLSMAQEVLAEHLARTDPIVHISDIESAVAAYFGLTPANIHSSRKDRTIALARHFSMYLTRKHTKMSSSEVGRFMGNKNHATVLLACRKVEDLLARNAELHWLSPVGNKIAKAKTILAELEASI